MAREIIGGKPIWFWDEMINKNHLNARIIKSVDINKNPTDNKNVDIVVLKGFLNRDITFSATNEWASMKSKVNENVSGAVEGGTGISTTTNSEDLNSMSGTLLDKASFFTDKLDQLSNFLGIKKGEDLASKMRSSFKALNTQFINYAESAKVYSGTTVEFPNSISLMLLADKLGSDPRKPLRDCLGDMVGIPLDNLSEYYSKVKREKGDSKGERSNTSNKSEDGSWSALLMDSMKLWNETINQSDIGFMAPPGGYSYDPKNGKDTGKPQEGTLTLLLGDKLVIKNLLVNNIDIDVSQFTTIENFPLWVRVDISFTPSVIFTSSDISVALGDNKGKVNSFSEGGSDYKSKEVYKRNTKFSGGTNSNSLTDGVGVGKKLIERTVEATKSANSAVFGSNTSSTTNYFKGLYSNPDGIGVEKIKNSNGLSNSDILKHASVVNSYRASLGESSLSEPALNSLSPRIKQKSESWNHLLKSTLT